uniref:Uncharacterized protein n=1 Tax=Magallana gigas TaxID=29159 RepID=A0A8W8L6Y1_MAGGI
MNPECDINTRISSLPKDVSSILLAGSYAECPMVQTALTEAFKSPHREVFSPDMHTMVGWCGAVMYGHQPKIYS